MATGNTEKPIFLLIGQYNPPGTEGLVPPDLYAGAYTWSLYIADQFACSGRRFSTQGEAFAAANEFLETLPSQDIRIISPNSN